MTTRAEGRVFVSALTLVSAAAVFATRWPLRSHTLFSWDSANFALAMARIDIAAHRPHPPGYLGYVIAGRAIQRIAHDPNTALVVWNIAVTMLAAAVVIRWAWECTDGEPEQARTTAATAAILVTSPLFWFYGEIAEIYPSELAGTVLVAFTAWRAIRGRRGSVVWCAVAIAVSAVFKVTAAILIFPLALYAWRRAPRPERRRSALLAVILLVVSGAVFLALEPRLPAIVWGQFATSTAPTRLVGGSTGVMRALNTNVRDTLRASLSALGVVNVAALLVWMAIDRRLPGTLGRAVAALWLMPWLLLFLTIHIGRMGYVLPLLPLGVLVVAGFYGRQRRSLAIVLVAMQVVANVAQFVWLTPPSRATVGGDALYRNKTLLERAASDLEAVTFPTAFTIAASDRRAAGLFALVDGLCPSHDPIIVAETDWRRLLWYFPQATAINTGGRDVVFIGTATNAVSIPASGRSLVTRCPVIWLLGDDGRPTPLTPPTAIAVPGVGAISDPGTIVVTPTTIARARSTQ